jgi:hypothetical protein
MRFSRDLVLVILGLAAVGAVLEGALRLARDRTQASLFQSESERGYSLRPNAEGWNVDDGEAWVRINSDGYRDRERVVPLPADTLRIAILGASHVEAEQVPLEVTFPARMERGLDATASRHGRHVEVLNFGVAGYSFSQNYLTLRNNVWKYGPRIVILVAATFSVLKSVPDLYPGPPKGTPFYRLRDGHLELDRSAGLAAPDPRRQKIKNLLSDLMNRSYLLSLFNMARARLPAHLAAVRKTLGLRDESGGSSLPPDYAAVWPFLPDLPQTQTAWAISEALLLEMRDECRRRGAEFYVVVADAEAQAHPDPFARASYARRLGVPSLDLGDRRFQAFGAANGIGVLPLAPTITAWAEAHAVPLHGPPQAYNHGHWNELGNRIAAEAINRYLYQQSSILNEWTGTR